MWGHNTFGRMSSSSAISAESRNSTTTSCWPLPWCSGTSEGPWTSPAMCSANTVAGTRAHSQSNCTPACCAGPEAGLADAALSWRQDTPQTDGRTTATRIRCGTSARWSAAQPANAAARCPETRYTHARTRGRRSGAGSMTTAQCCAASSDRRRRHRHDGSGAGCCRSCRRSLRAHGRGCRCLEASTRRERRDRGSLWQSATAPMHDKSLH